MECKKCKLLGNVILRKKDYYCSNCHLVNTNHKFRACIGKNKILSSNQKVLTCLSGGSGSTVLLDLIYNGINMESHKKLRINPYFLHIIGITNPEQDIKIATHIIQQCKKYGFDLFVVHTSDYHREHLHLPEVNVLPLCNTAESIQFDALLSSMTSTTKLDFLQKVKQNLFTSYAKLLQCEFVFTAETTTTLAISLLSNLAIGRGSQVEDDVGFADTRDSSSIILRPMRDISGEELDYYINIKELNPLQSNDKQQQSIQTIIKDFVTDLQDNFQSTISTVCKTADKLGVLHDNDNLKCTICKSKLDSKVHKLSAFEATNLSSIVSTGQLNKEDLKDKNHLSELMVSAINKHICYTCYRNYSTVEELSLVKS